MRPPGFYYKNLHVPAVLVGVPTNLIFVKAGWSWSRAAKKKPNPDIYDKGESACDVMKRVCGSLPDSSRHSAASTCWRKKCHSRMRQNEFGGSY